MNKIPKSVALSNTFIRVFFLTRPSYYKGALPNSNNVLVKFRVVQSICFMVVLELYIYMCFDDSVTLLSPHAPLFIRIENYPFVKFLIFEGVKRSQYRLIWHAGNLNILDAYIICIYLRGLNLNGLKAIKFAGFLSMYLYSANWVSTAYGFFVAVKLVKGIKCLQLYWGK